MLYIYILNLIAYQVWLIHLDIYKMLIFLMHQNVNCRIFNLHLKIFLYLALLGAYIVSISKKYRVVTGLPMIYQWLIYHKNNICACVVANVNQFCRDSC